MEREDFERGRRLTKTLLLACAVTGTVACQASNDAEAARGVGSQPALTADPQESDQDDGLRVDAERGTVTRETAIRVGGVPVSVEIADNPQTRSQGLMHRDSLPEDHGMLFVYPQEQILSFWMRNTKFPLDIAFIDGNGTILEVQQMEPHDDASHQSSEPAMYALELRFGWFADHGVGPGDRVEF